MGAPSCHKLKFVTLPTTMMQGDSCLSCRLSATDATLACHICCCSVPAHLITATCTAARELPAQVADIISAEVQKTGGFHVKLTDAGSSGHLRVLMQIVAGWLKHCHNISTPPARSRAIVMVVQ